MFQTTKNNTYDMKKLLYIIAITIFASSCSTLRKSSATVMDVETSITSKNTAELVVSDEKISYTYTPTKADRKAGLKHVEMNAVAAALKENENADVLVHKNQEVVYRINMFGCKKIKSVTVTGYPANYKNFSLTK